MKTIILHIWGAKLAAAGDPVHAGLEIGSEYFSFCSNDRKHPFKLTSKAEDSDRFKAMEYVELTFASPDSENALEKISSRFSKTPNRLLAIRGCVNDIAMGVYDDARFIQAIAKIREAVFSCYLNEYNAAYKQLQVLFDESLSMIRSETKGDSRVQYAKYIGHEHAKNHVQNLNQIVGRLSPVLLKSAPSVNGKQCTAREWLSQIFQTINAGRNNCLLLAKLCWTTESALYKNLEQKLLNSAALLSDDKYKRLVDHVKITSPGGRKGHFVPGVPAVENESKSGSEQSLFFVERVKIVGKAFSHANPFMFKLKVSEYNFQRRQWDVRINKLDNPFRHFSSVGPLSACPQIVIPHYLFARINSRFFYLNTEKPASENIYRYRVTTSTGAPVLSVMKQAVVTSGRKVDFKSDGWLTDLATCTVVFDYKGDSMPMNTAFFSRNYAIPESKFSEYVKKASASSISIIEQQGSDTSAKLSMGAYFSALPKLFANAYNLKAQPGWVSFKALNDKYIKAFVDKAVVFGVSSMKLKSQQGFKDLNGLEAGASSEMLCTYAAPRLPDRNKDLNELKQAIFRSDASLDARFCQASERLTVLIMKYVDELANARQLFSALVSVTNKGQVLGLADSLNERIKALAKTSFIVTTPNAGKFMLPGIFQWAKRLGCGDIKISAPEGLSQGKNRSKTHLFNGGAFGFGHAHYKVAIQTNYAVTVSMADKNGVAHVLSKQKFIKKINHQDLSNENEAVNKLMALTDGALLISPSASTTPMPEQRFDAEINNVVDEIKQSALTSQSKLRRNFSSAVIKGTADGADIHKSLKRLEAVRLRLYALLKENDKLPEDISKSQFLLSIDEIMSPFRKIMTAKGESVFPAQLNAGFNQVEVKAMLAKFVALSASQESEATSTTQSTVSEDDSSPSSSSGEVIKISESKLSFLSPPLSKKPKSDGEAQVLTLLEPRANS